MRKWHSFLKNKYIRYFFVTCFWIFVWHVISVLVGNELLLVSPAEAIKVLIGYLKEGVFWKTIGMSLVRITSGLLLGVALGNILAILSYRFRFVEELIVPLINLLKTIPVVSFVVLLLIWWGAGYLSVCVCFLIVFPSMYINVLEGLKNAPKELLEMAEVFQLSPKVVFFYIYRPALRPFFDSALSLSLGMCWKSGVAAEVIGTPAMSIGEKLYMSKIYLDTGGIFAWTAVIVIMSIAFEKIAMQLMQLFFMWEPKVRKSQVKVEEPITEDMVELVNVSASYGSKNVLTNYSEIYPTGGINYLTWPSGEGKTTLLRLIAGLEKPTEGYVAMHDRCAMVFQEDRLCMDYSAVRNVELVTGDWERSEKALQRLLKKEVLYKPCQQLSGGEKRRVALVRAMESDSRVLLLDEPFTGMDDRNVNKAMEYIREKSRGRVVIIATHFIPPNA